MKDIPEVPILSETQKEAFAKFLKKINSWRKFFEDLGFKTVDLTSYNTNPEEGMYYPDDVKGAIIGSVTPLEAGEQGLIICGAGYVTAIQFMKQTYWPDEINYTPYYIEFGFGTNNNAFVIFDDNEGSMLFDKEKHFPGGYENRKVEGTWEEIVRKLITISDEMRAAMAIESPPTK